MHGGSRPPPERGDSSRRFLITLIAVLAVAAFMSPLLRSVAYSVKSIDQITQAHSPLYPADPVTFSYQGQELPILNVPMPDGTIRQLALLEPLRRQSTFIDPAAPDAAPIEWQGSWRTLEPIWQFAPHWENFGKVWDLIDYPRLLFNTVFIGSCRPSARSSRARSSRTASRASGSPAAHSCSPSSSRRSSCPRP